LGPIRPERWGCHTKAVATTGLRRRLRLRGFAQIALLIARGFLGFAIFFDVEGGDEGSGEKKHGYQKEVSHTHKYQLNKNSPTDRLRPTDMSYLMVLIHPLAFFS
jgi:hypothetical protein